MGLAHFSSIPCNPQIITQARGLAEDRNCSSQLGCQELFVKVQGTEASLIEASSLERYALKLSFTYKVALAAFYCYKPIHRHSMLRRNFVLRKKKKNTPADQISLQFPITMHLPSTSAF